MRHKFPRPWNGPFLEIVAEGKITQHFEEGMVPRRPANHLYIRCPQALLAGSNAPGRWHCGSGEIRFERNHAGSRPQKGGVAGGYKGGAGQNLMVSCSEETEKPTSYFLPGQGSNNPSQRLVRRIGPLWNRPNYTGKFHLGQGRHARDSLPPDHPPQMSNNPSDRQPCSLSAVHKPGARRFRRVRPRPPRQGVPASYPRPGWRPAG